MVRPPMWRSRSLLSQRCRRTLTPHHPPSTSLVKHISVILLSLQECGPYNQLLEKWKYVPNLSHRYLRVNGPYQVIMWQSALLFGSDRTTAARVCKCLHGCPNITCSEPSRSRSVTTRTNPSRPKQTSNKLSRKLESDAA